MKHYITALLILLMLSVFFSVSTCVKLIDARTDNRELEIRLKLTTELVDKNRKQAIMYRYGYYTAHESILPEGHKYFADTLDKMLNFNSDGIPEELTP